MREKRLLYKTLLFQGQAKEESMQKDLRPHKRGYS